jgi:hypothetical protein
MFNRDKKTKSEHNENVIAKCFKRITKNVLAVNRTHILAELGVRVQRVR